MKYLTKEQYELKLQAIKLENLQIKMRNKLKEEKRKYRPTIFSRIAKASTSNKVLFASIMAIVLYTIVALMIQFQTSMEVSTTLSTLWYGFWTVEITALAGIKVTKVIKDYHPNDTEDVDDSNDTGAMG